ncbi:MAG: hypothetical protein WBC43_12135 [Olleya sp.]
MIFKQFRINSFFTLFITLILFCGFAIGQSKKQQNYYSLLDSAQTYLDVNPKISAQFLDSIPNPITSNITGRLAYYYQLKGLLNDKNEEPIKQFQNFALALKHAKLEKDYDIAGMVSVELFYNSYLINKDSTAFKYLEDAKSFYTKTNNVNGLAEVSQMYAYIPFDQGDYAKSNALLLSNLQQYKNIIEDQYYYMYALFMLTSNYAHLDNLNTAHYYFNLLKNLENDNTIASALYKSHIVTINNCFAHIQFKQKAMDSVAFYLDASTKMRQSMNSYDVKEYFKLYADYYGQLGNDVAKNNYLDSLSVFNDELLQKASNASLELNNALVNTDEALLEVTKKRNTNRIWIAILIGAIIVFGTFIALRYKKIKLKFIEFTKRKDEYQFMQTNHEKLKVKVRGLEDYITELKRELRTISSIDNSSEQKEKTKALYKNIHHQSSTFLAKEENYLELINDVNIEFFTQIKAMHPNLNDSEIIICYYLFLGFKNKEIAAFLNTSTRAVESKRYRISKKIEELDSTLTLIDYLNDTFKDSKISVL